LYLEGLLAVHVEPVGANEVLLVKHCVVRAQEMEVLELNQAQGSNLIDKV
jgi:hypothetical protein